VIGYNYNTIITNNSIKEQKMANIYVTDETKELLEKVSKADHRTQDGEIIFLLEKRAEQQREDGEL